MLVFLFLLLEPRRGPLTVVHDLVSPCPERCSRHSYLNQTGNQTGEAFGSMVQWSNRYEPIQPPVQLQRTVEANRPHMQLNRSIYLITNYISD
jgi:hypothetical protein